MPCKLENERKHFTLNNMISFSFINTQAVPISNLLCLRMWILYLPAVLSFRLGIPLVFLEVKNFITFPGMSVPPLFLKYDFIGYHFEFLPSVYLLSSFYMPWPVKRLLNRVIRI